MCRSSFWIEQIKMKNNGKFYIMHAPLTMLTQFPYIIPQFFNFLVYGCFYPD